MSGGRFPSNSIWPSKQEICIVLTIDPLAPDNTISCKLFSGNLHVNPAGKQVLQRKYQVCTSETFILKEHNLLVYVICIVI